MINSFGQKVPSSPSDKPIAQQSIKSAQGTTGKDENVFKVPPPPVSKLSKKTSNENSSLFTPKNVHPIGVKPLTSPKVAFADSTSHHNSLSKSSALITSTQSADISQQIIDNLYSKENYKHFSNLQQHNHENHNTMNFNSTASASTSLNKKGEKKDENMKITAAASPSPSRANMASAQSIMPSLPAITPTTLKPLSSVLGGSSSGSVMSTRQTKRI